MKATDLVKKINLLIELEGDFEILTTAPGGELFELCEVEPVKVQECFYTEGFSGKQFVEVGIGTSDKLRKRVEKYIVIE